MLSDRASAEPLRIATYDAGLKRDGPGLLLRDLLKPDEQAHAAMDMIVALDADILLLTGMDQDAQGASLTALAEGLAQRGLGYPHRLPLPGNRGLETPRDLDGDGRRGGPGDAQGWGRFTGAGAMALLSRYPIDHAGIIDITGLLWRDLPGADLPRRDGAAFPSEEAQAAQLLSSSGHYAVPVRLPKGRITLLVFAATPPVFDGPEDANGRRNADEIRVWAALLRGMLEHPPPPPPRVLMGNFNLDPHDGEGLRQVMVDLLAGSLWQDPGPAASSAPSGDPTHVGPAAQDTAFWRPTAEGGPGALRVDYVLPEHGMTVRRSGVMRSGSTAQGADIAARASAHRPVWIEVEVPPPVP
ncbi:MAG: endonuclease/exonuclease/phosphatase family protein [Celeribacter sp.]